MNKKLLRSMRDQLAPDESVLQRTIELAQGTGKEETKDIITDKSNVNDKHRASVYHSRYAGLIAAVLAFTVGAGAMLLAIDRTGHKDTSSFVSKETRQSVERNFIVYLDPGHGGEDTGFEYGEGEDIRLEKDDDLRLSLAVRDSLLDKGVDVRMSRDNDFSPYSKIENIYFDANNEKADLLVSVHRHNASSGVSAWIHSSDPEPDRVLAENITSALAEAGTAETPEVHSGYNDGNGTGASLDYVVNSCTVMPSCMLFMGNMADEEDNRLFDEKLTDYADAIADAIIKSAEDLGIIDENGERLIDGQMISETKLTMPLEEYYPELPYSETEIGYPGTPISEAEIAEKVDEIKTTVAGYIASENEGLSGRINISLEGYSYLQRYDMTVALDSVTLPVFTDEQGIIVGEVVLFRSEGEISSSIMAGGDRYTKMNAAFQASPNDKFAYVYVGELMEVMVGSDGTVYPLREGSETALDSEPDPYGHLATDRNVFSLKEIRDSHKYITVDLDDILNRKASDDDYEKAIETIYKLEIGMHEEEVVSILNSSGAVHEDSKQHTLRYYDDTYDFGDYTVSVIFVGGRLQRVDMKNNVNNMYDVIMPLEYTDLEEDELGDYVGDTMYATLNKWYRTRELGTRDKVLAELGEPDLSGGNYDEFYGIRINYDDAGSISGYDIYSESLQQWRRLRSQDIYISATTSLATDTYLRELSERYGFVKEESETLYTISNAGSQLTLGMTQYAAEAVLQAFIPTNKDPRYFVTPECKYVYYAIGNDYSLALTFTPENELSSVDIVKDEMISEEYKPDLLSEYKIKPVFYNPEIRYGGGMNSVLTLWSDLRQCETREEVRAIAGEPDCSDSYVDVYCFDGSALVLCYSPAGRITEMESYDARIAQYFYISADELEIYYPE